MITDSELVARGLRPKKLQIDRVVFAKTDNDKALLFKLKKEKIDNTEALQSIMSCGLPRFGSLKINGFRV